jgi:hypothetical protein
MRDVFNSKPKSHQGQGQIWREAHAELIDQLGAAKAKTIAQTAFFLEAQTGRGLMYQVANQPAPSVRALRPERPQELADILNKTLSKSPAQRYQTGGQTRRRSAQGHCRLAGVHGRRQSARQHVCPDRAAR